MCHVKPCDCFLVKRLIDLLTKHFQCNSAEFWSLDDVSQSYSKFDPSIDSSTPSQHFSLISKKNAGAVGPLLVSCVSMNSEDISKLPDYNLEVDGPPGESLLAVPYHLNSQTIAVVLRGKSGKTSFGAVDSNQLQSLVPLIAPTVATFGGVPNDENISSSDFALRLKALHEVAMIISRVVDIDVLIPTIMQRACQLLNTERCSLFLVDSSKQELISRFHGGFDKSLRLPINGGIVCHTVQKPRQHYRREQRSSV